MPFQYIGSDSKKPCFDVVYFNRNEHTLTESSINKTVQLIMQFEKTIDLPHQVCLLRAVGEFEVLRVHALKAKVISFDSAIAT